MFLKVSVSPDWNNGMQSPVKARDPEASGRSQILKIGPLEKWVSRWNSMGTTMAGEKT